MARIVSRKPVIGIVAGLLFGALGWLLIGMEGTPAGVTPMAPILFRIAGSFFLFVASMALMAAILAILRSLRSR